jgi:hypothetical protein
VKVRTDEHPLRPHTGTRNEESMSTNTDKLFNVRLEREVARERHERVLHDEQRTGLTADEEFRLKDARENAGSCHIKRPNGR